MAAFSSTKTITQSWNIFKKEWKFVYLVFLAVVILQMVLQGVLGSFEKAGVLLAIVGVILSIGVSNAIQMGMQYLFILMARGKKPEFQDALEPLEPWTRILTFFGGSLLYGLIVLVGFILLIVPGVIWALKYMFVPYILIDKKTTISEAFEMSAKMTDGNKLELFLMGVLVFLINLGGLLALVVGVLITGAFTALVPAVAYVTLSKTGSTAKKKATKKKTSR